MPRDTASMCITVYWYIQKVCVRISCMYVCGCVYMYVCMYESERKKVLCSVCQKSPSVLVSCKCVLVCTQAPASPALSAAPIIQEGLAQQSCSLTPPPLKPLFYPSICNGPKAALIPTHFLQFTEWSLVSAKGASCSALLCRSLEDLYGNDVAESVVW